MITPLDSRVMDANAESLGVSVKTLMGNAGKAIADFLLQNFPNCRYAFCCGHGNNGGDGYAAACNLSDRDVKLYSILPVGNIKSETVQFYANCTDREITPFSECDFDFDVLVDCGLGTGLDGKLKPEYAAYVDKTNSFKGVIVSIDVPTGLGTDKAVKPNHTIALHDLKTGMSEETCGKITVADISMPCEAYLETGPGDLLRYPVPKSDSHKGSNGNLLIIGGGPYFGAPAMAGMGALRTGTDLVTIAAPESVFHEIAAVSPVLMVERLEGKLLTPDHLETIQKLARKSTAVLIGPGLGTDPVTSETVKAFMTKCDKPVVIDADGLNCLGTEFKFNGNVILTPHAKEYERLGGTEKTPSALRDFASSHGCTVLLKGSADIISDGVQTKINRTGCSAMTGAGTGDVLSGIVAGLLSKKMNTFDAACLGAFISGKAGELAYEDYSYGLIATDIIEKIPKILPGGNKR